MTAADDYFASEDYRRALLTRLTRHIFGTEKAGARNIFRTQRFQAGPAPDAATEASGPPTAAGEGANPAPGYRFSDRDHLRQLTREMFTPNFAVTDPVTFDVLP